jgi:putative PIN family toxin of toxin-antitoxin system
VRIVQDTNVFVSALRSGGGASRQVLLSCLKRLHDPLMAQALWTEYEDLLSRPELWKNTNTTAAQRKVLLDALAAVAVWVEIWFLWRPNLPDENDNHLMELAFNGNAAALVTHNIKHFRRAELVHGVDVLTPGKFIKKYAE